MKNVAQRSYAMGSQSSVEFSLYLYNYELIIRFDIKASN